MEHEQFFTAARVLIVAGKGGVGKTTVSATIALAAAERGLDVTIVEIEGKYGLATAFGTTPLGYAASVLRPAAPGRGEIRGRSIAADDALVDYFAEHGLSRFGRTLTKMQVLDTLATATPGLKDLIVLGRIKQIERDDPAALIVVDAPASGHAMSFLLSARGLQATARSGPIRRQADEASELLADPTRCRVALVTLAEETPVNELVETAYRLEDEVGVALAPLVVNAVDRPRPGLGDPAAFAAAVARRNVPAGLADELAAAASFWNRRAAVHQEQLARLTELLPLEQVILPRVPRSRLGLPELELLAGAFADGVADLHWELT